MKKYQLYFEDMDGHEIRKEYITDSKESARAMAENLCHRMNITGPGRGWAFRVDLIPDRKKIVRQARKMGYDKADAEDIAQSLYDSVTLG